MLKFADNYLNELEVTKDVEASINNTLNLMLKDIVNEKKYSLLVTSKLSINMSTGDIILSQKHKKDIIVIPTEDLFYGNYKKGKIKELFKFMLYKIYLTIDFIYKQSIQLLNNYTYNARKEFNSLKCKYGIVITKTELLNIFEHSLDAYPNFNRDEKGTLILEFDSYIYLEQNYQARKENNLDFLSRHSLKIDISKALTSLNFMYENTQLSNIIEKSNQLIKLKFSKICDTYLIKTFSSKVKEFPILSDMNLEFDINNLLPNNQLKIDLYRKRLCANQQFMLNYLLEYDINSQYTKLFKDIPEFSDSNDVSSENKLRILSKLYEFSINPNKEITHIDFENKLLPQNLNNDSYIALFNDSLKVLEEAIKYANSKNIKELEEPIFGEVSVQKLKYTLKGNEHIEDEIYALKYISSLGIFERLNAVVYFNKSGEKIKSKKELKKKLENLIFKSNVKTTIKDL